MYAIYRICKKSVRGNRNGRNQEINLPAVTGGSLWLSIVRREKENLSVHPGRENQAIGDGDIVSRKDRGTRAGETLIIPSVGFVDCPIRGRFFSAAKRRRGQSGQL